MLRIEASLDSCIGTWTEKRTMWLGTSVVLRFWYVRPMSCTMVATRRNK